MEGKEEQNSPEEDEELDTETKRQGAGKHLSAGWGVGGGGRSWSILRPGILRSSGILLFWPPLPRPRGMFGM